MSYQIYLQSQLSRPKCCTWTCPIRFITWRLFMPFLLLLSSEGLRPETTQLFSSSSKKKGKSGSKGGAANEEEPKADFQPVSIHLHFKRYVFDPHKKMVQSWPSLTSLSDATAAAVAAGSVRGLLEVRCAQALQIRDLLFLFAFFFSLSLDGDSLLKCCDCGMLNTNRDHILLL